MSSGAAGWFERWARGGWRGAVGVVGTMVALEVKMRQVNERSKCPYCSGSGQLTCARCYGQQTVSYRTADGQVSACVGG